MTMALLTTAKRKAYFKFLGLGEYNKENIKKFQKQYFTRKQNIDGIWGPDTDILARHVYNVRKICKNFEPEEFKCECGGKYCAGYPVQMKAVELANLQTIRTQIGKPMRITSGLRCKAYNSTLKGAASNSRHLTGYAADFVIAGKTDTLSGRKSLIAILKKLPNHRYSYCDGYDSSGYKISASYMGNAIHTECYPGEVSSSSKTAAKTAATTTTTNATDIGFEVVTFASTQKGKYATRTNHGKDGKKYSNKFTKYFAGQAGIDKKGQMPAAYGYIPGWCTLFVIYCLVVKKAAVASQLLKNLNTKKKGYWWHAPSLMKYFNKKKLIKTDFTKAKKGAIVFKGTKKLKPTHTCLFWSRSGNKVTTWDGNVNGVSKNTRKKSAFLGFVNPPYK